MTAMTGVYPQDKHAPPGITPWHRQMWPWLLMLMPTIALVGGLFTAWLAVTTSDSLVVDDYYRQGKAINQEIARDRLALQRHMLAALQNDAQGISIRLTADAGVALPAQLKLKVIHATRVEFDREATLTRAADGLYRVDGIRLPEPGRWRVQIEDETGKWRLVGIAHSFDTPMTLGEPQP